jgi:hypothetical protein
MASEAEIIIAFLFKRSGRKELSFTEGFLSLSMDLNWFSPESAKEFLNNCIKNKLISKDNGKIKPEFNFEEIKVPVGFYPTKITFEKTAEEKEIKNDGLKEALLTFIGEKANINRKELLEMMNNFEIQKNVLPEIALMLIAKKYNLNIEEFYNQIEEKIFEK